MESKRFSTIGLYLTMGTLSAPANLQVFVLDYYAEDEEDTCFLPFLGLISQFENKPLQHIVLAFCNPMYSTYHFQSCHLIISRELTEELR
jgi:hypothetical protein